MIDFKKLLIKSYIITILLVIPTERVLAEAEEASDPSLLTLERIFTSEEFKAEKFGPARWLEDGTGYTTLEDSNSLEKGNIYLSCCSTRRAPFETCALK